MKNLKKGFTLIELLVVVAIIGVLASVILALLNGARMKGNDAGVKANLGSAQKQAEIFYMTNTAAPNSYTNVCLNGVVAGSSTITTQVTAAAKASGLASYTRNNATPSISVASCNDSANAWAAEVPLDAVANTMWCVDSTGKSLQETAFSLSSATDYTCI